MSESEGTTIFLAATKSLGDWSVSHTLGGLTFFCAAMLALVFVLQHERWRRLWLGQEDPRALGLFRIAFGLVTIFNINGMWELFSYLFTDEGLFLTDTARMIRARQQFEGFGHGLGDDPYGFFDFAAFWQWLKGPKYSLLLFWSSPTAFWIHWAAFQIAMILMVLGLWTRPATWIAWFLFHSIILRNRVYWEGTEHVFRCLFFYLAISRCGHAYSLDNWLRHRRNRRKGVAEPIHRLIPRWPRLLIVFQVAALYMNTGLLKSGPVWRRGDSLYYALSLDHFQRFPLHGVPWEYIMPLFRMNSHVTRAWEVFFPLVAIGVVIRMALHEPVHPLPKWRTWTIRAVWVLFAVGLLSLFASLPSEYRFVGVGKPLMEPWQLVTAGLVGVALGAWLLWRLRHKPFSLRMRGSEYVLDLEWLCRWFLGRRIWLTLGVIFHMHLIVLMNIGWFSPVLLVSYLCFFSGEEIGRILGIIRRWWAQSRGRPTPRTTSDDFARDSDPPRPVTSHLRTPEGGSVAPALPMTVLLVAWTLAVGGVVGVLLDLITPGWIFAALAALLVGATVTTKSQGARGKRGDEGEGEPPRPLAYGPWGRLIIGSLIAYHITAVAAWLIPDGEGFKQWRKDVRDPFEFWLEHTQTTQSWGMFSPNPPRGDRFMRVLVTDHKGEAWDLKSDIYVEERRVIPWIWYTRQGKINRRIIGNSSKWYRKWHARYVCRKWAQDHHGIAPIKVELRKIYVPTLDPREAIRKGTPEPMERVREAGRETTVYTALCVEEPDGILPTAIRKRHGIPHRGDPVRRWNRLENRKEAWEKRHR